LVDNGHVMLITKLNFHNVHIWYWCDTLWLTTYEHNLWSTFHIYCDCKIHCTPRNPNLQSRLPFHTQEPERCCTRMKRWWTTLCYSSRVFVCKDRKQQCVTTGGNARVNRPIIDKLPMTEHFDKKFHFFSILSDLKCYRSTFSSFTNHLWNAKPNNQSKKSSKESTFFRIAKHFLFHFDPSHFQTS